MNCEEEIRKIQERNQKVEAEKAWEISKTRIIIIATFTYLVTTSVFYIIGLKNFYMNSLIPTIGYLLSTLSIPIIKKRWINHYNYNNRRENVRRKRSATG